MHSSQASRRGGAIQSAVMSDTVEALHHRDVQFSSSISLVWCEPTDSAVVLGSAQSREIVDERAATRRGLSIVQRRSGGAALIVSPTNMLWCDILVPRSSYHFVDDLARSFHGIGTMFSRALHRVGITDIDVYTGQYVQPPWGHLGCFIGRGPGECFHRGRKVVGISQKRTRSGAWFQCAVILRGCESLLGGVLVRETAEREAFIQALRASVFAVGESRREVLAREIEDSLTAWASETPTGEPPAIP